MAGGLYESGLVLKMQEVGDTIFCAESLKTPFSRLLKRGSKPVSQCRFAACSRSP
jgi:hypothetical protein